MSEVEEWRATHHPGYDVSNLGRVRSWMKTRWGLTKGRRKEPKILATGPDRNGYPLVSLGINNTQKVHHLVAAAFIGPRPPKQEVRHKDDDPRNARADNLEYGTRRDNILDSVKRRRWGHTIKLTPADVREIRRLSEGGAKQVDLAAQFKVRQPTISCIVLRQTWSHV